MFAVEFIGGGYVLLALVENSWWRAVMVVVGIPVALLLVARGYRRRGRSGSRAVGEEHARPESQTRERRP
jgi:hypothetical protein